MLPAYLRQEFEKLNSVEQAKLYELLQWGSVSGIPDTILPISSSTYENALRMVKQMGLVEEIKENKETEE